MFTIWVSLSHPVNGQESVANAIFFPVVLAFMFFVIVELLVTIIKY